MAIAASNPFSVGIKVFTSSTPTVQEERDTYTRWGWTWNEATANPVFNSDPSYNPGTISVHYDTEADDLWNYMQAYNRRISGQGGYLDRATWWRNYWVNTYQGSAADSEESSFGGDHINGNGLLEWAAQFSDSAALSAAVTLINDQRTFWSTLVGGSWPVAGVYSISYYGPRGPARTLFFASKAADATGNANAIELRDRLIDLFTQSPDWDDTRGMYWVGEFSFQGWGFESAPYNMDYTNGDRVNNTFQLGVVANALYAAYNSTGVTTTRKTALRTKLVKLALFFRTYGVDTSAQLAGSYIGIRGSTGAVWHSNSSEFHTPPLFWDGSYGIALVNLLVIGYKLTGDRNYLDGTPVIAVPGVFPAKYMFNRHTKAVYGGATTRECGDTVAGHFQDTKFATPGSNFFAYNKGEFQYTHMIFENGGIPTII